MFIINNPDFFMGLSQFIVVGVINDLANDFEVSLSSIGILVTLFAVVYAIATPTINMFVGNIPLQKAIIIFIMLFSLGNLLSVVSINYTTCSYTRKMDYFSSIRAKSLGYYFKAFVLFE